VYSVYDVSAAYLSPRSNRYAAVAAKAVGGETGKVYTFASLGELDAVFSADGEATSLYGCVNVLLRSGVSRVLAVKVEDDYEAAFSLLADEENIAAIVCDSEDEDVLLDLKDSILASSLAQKERVGFCGAAEAALALDLAAELNSERMIVCCPAVGCADSAYKKAAYGAAALAGAVLARNDPAYSFNGEPQAAVSSPMRLPEAKMQELIRGGVTVLEERGGVTGCVRAVTTRTKSGGEVDYALRGLNAILCIDDVMRHVRATLRAVLRGGRTGGRSTESIRSQTVIALADRLDAGILESYEPPRCYPDASDPTVCVVELSFRVAHVMSQIHVRAEIQV
jgi:hypothetical protein